MLYWLSRLEYAVPDDSRVVEAVRRGVENGSRCAVGEKQVESVLTRLSPLQHRQAARASTGVSPLRVGVGATPGLPPADGIIAMLVKY